VGAATVGDAVAEPGAAVAAGWAANTSLPVTTAIETTHGRGVLAEELERLLARVAPAERIREGWLASLLLKWLAEATAAHVACFDPASAGTLVFRDFVGLVDSESGRALPGTRRRMMREVAEALVRSGWGRERARAAAEELWVFAEDTGVHFLDGRAFGRATAFVALRDALADVYDTFTEADRVIRAAGIEALEPHAGDQAADYWHEVLQRALPEGRIAALLDRALGEFRENVRLRRAIMRYRTNYPAGPATASATH